MAEYTPQQYVKCPKCKTEIHLTGEVLACSCGKRTTFKFKKNTK